MERRSFLKISKSSKKEETKKSTPKNPFMKRTTNRKSNKIPEEPSKPTIDSSQYNILYIDRKVKEYLSARIDFLPFYRKRLQKYIQISSSSLIQESQKAKSEIPEIRRLIQDLESTLEYGCYIRSTSRLVERYSQLIKKKRSGFMGKTSSKQSPEELEIIFNFLTAAKRYVSITNIKQKPNTICPDCGNYYGIKDDEHFCEECGHIVNIMDDSPTFKDSDRVNMTSKYSYSRRGHFIDAIKRYQGKQNTTIPQSVYDHIYLQMSYYNLTKETVTKDNVYMFLSEMKSDVKHYEDINLIYSKIKEEPCPDISIYEVELLRMFDIHDKVYEEQIKSEDRDNSQQVYFKLYKFLGILGYPCKRDEFYILKTEGKEEEHEEEWDKACKIIGWE